VSYLYKQRPSLVSEDRNEPLGYVLDIVNRLTLDEKRALQDLWRVYRENASRITGQNSQLALENPQIAPYLASMSPHQFEKLNRDTPLLMQRGLEDGDWKPYLDRLRFLGTDFAHRGVSFESWFRVYGTFRKVLVPALYEAYGAEDPVRYQNSILAMDLFIGIAKLVIGRAYLDTKDEIAQAQELERRRLEQHLFESGKLALLGRLAASVAHEVNNPLESIKNVLHLAIEDEPENSSKHRLLQIAETETERISNIVRQMLGMYRVRTELDPIDIEAVVRDCLDLLAWDLSKNGILVLEDFSDGLPSAFANADQLKQVFCNLFLNARDAMPDGGELHVGTRLSNSDDDDFSPGKWVLAEVRDTGVGIAADNLDRIFEPFFSTKPSGRGLGLGLWISQGIVQGFGGQIRVRSVPHRGATFTVYLPVGGSHARPDPAVAGGRRPRRSPYSKSRPGTRKVRSPDRQLAR
jgi:signal transduction histidine kinase